MPDGRLITITGNTIGTTHELRVILHWFDELRQRNAAGLLVTLEDHLDAHGQLAARLSP